MVYSLEERVEIVELYFKNNNCSRATARIFNERHPDKTLSHPYVTSLLTKFRETGSVANKKHHRNRPFRNEAIEVAVLGHVSLDNTQSTKQLSEASGVSQTTVRRILKDYQFHPYKVHLVQELNEDDDDRRLQFCEEMSARLVTNPDLLYNICFSDECSFFVNGTVNRHNCRYWSDTNPRIFRETHSQHPEKLNVWAGILGKHIVGPFFLPDTLNGEQYLNLLENYIDPMITEIIENDDDHAEENLFFQQDGAPPHYAVPVR